MYSGTVKARRWCAECDRHVLAETNPPDCSWWCVQMLITAVTCGLWLPVAVVWAALKTNALLCHECGAKVGSRRI